MAKSIAVHLVGAGRHQRIQRRAQLADIVQPHLNLVADLIAGDMRRLTVVAHWHHCGETEKLAVCMSLSATPSFFSAAKTACMRAVLAASAAAAVGASAGHPGRQRHGVGRGPDLALAGHGQGAGGAVWARRRRRRPAASIRAAKRTVFMANPSPNPRHAGPAGRQNHGAAWAYWRAGKSCYTPGRGL